MLRTHSRTNDVGIGVKSVAYWATQPNGSLIVFVHGFGSKATGAWKNFPELLSQETKAKGADYVFFGYDSLWSQTGASADDLRRLIDPLVSSPPAVINPLVPHVEARSRTFAYRRVVFVAHSFGAVIVRWALLKASGSPWLNRCVLVLFAPAHRGARAPGAALGLLGLVPNIGIALGTVVKYASPTLTDLEPGSQMLVQLLSRTQLELASGKAAHLKAHVVVFGRKEKVVLTDSFAEDPEPVSPWPHKKHTDVQCPAGGYRDPIAHVVKAL